MHSTIQLLYTVAVLSAGLVSAGSSGVTTRYWDCCKPACAWPSGSLTSPVKVCDIHDQPIDDVNAKSGCEGGPAYMCSSQAPWAVSDSLAYGFGGVSMATAKCCACYQLTFTSSAIAGKKMIVQATNTGSDVSSTQFDIAMPGGGFGIYDGCTTEWGATSDVWGAQYGGSSSNTCSQFPSPLQAGCGFRWDWMQGADNPTVDYEEVACPAEIVAKSGCSASGAAPAAAVDPGTDTPTGQDTASSSSTQTAAPSSTPPSSGSSSEPVPGKRQCRPSPRRFRRSRR